MKIIKVLFCTLLTLSAVTSFAGNFQKKDTVCYFVDTNKTPIKDRMLSIEIEGRFKCYVFEVVCLKHEKKPVFWYDHEKARGEILSNIKDVRFISLHELIGLAQEGGGDLFNNNHIAFFIEPENDHYIKHQVVLFKPQKRQVTY